ncbi:tetratricopeptide repeat protein [Streptomyces sp. NPDC002215]|uniref:tetratricopeptide repeat protein n=1 Tax=Streptomyces sp. NPDC002215 TaxID=3154412 RepID=UPI00332233C4
MDREADLLLLHSKSSDSPPNFGSRLIVLSGQDGIGTTTLASRLLHELQDRFRGGSLYVDLRGHEPEGSLPIGSALGQLLRSVRPGEPPLDTQERAAWWRSTTANRAPTCVLIDNAARAADIRAVLPGGSGHLVLVTSRHPLSELVGEGAYLHSLGPLPPDAAHTYLADRVGADRLQAEPDAAEQLIRLAAGYPAALVLTVAQVALHPQRPLSSAVRALIDSRRTTPRPPTLDIPGATMTAHHDAAYAGLSPDSAHTYRHLSLLPVRDIDASLTAAVCATTPQAATTALKSLADARLLKDIGNQDQRGPVYRFFSAELHQRARHIAEPHPQDQRLPRALGWALTATATADALITSSHSLTLNLNPVDLPHAPDHPVRHPDPDAALTWLKDQAENLLSLVRAAHRNGHHAYVWRIVYSMWPWWRSESRHDDWIELHSLALESLRHDQDGTEVAEWHLMSTLGLALRDTGSPQALQTFRRLRNMARQAEDPRAEAQALHELGATYLQMGHASQAVLFLTEARRIRKRLGYERGVALTDILLGQEVLARRHVDQAVRRFAGARRTLLDEGDIHDAARALAWQGLALIQAGDIPAAESALDTARQEFITAQAPRWAAQTLEWLGAAAEADSRPEDARARYTQAISGFQLVSTADADRVRIHLARVS